MNKRIDDVARQLLAFRNQNKELKYFPKEMEQPPISIEKAAKLILEQQEFIKTETLAMDLMVFYLVNTDVFNCIISDELKNAANWDPKYLDESASEIAGMVRDGEVWGVPTGIFTAWGTRKATLSSFKIDLAYAAQEAYDYRTHGI